MMLDLLIVLAVGLAVLPWAAVKVMCRRADMESMDSRAWINYLADRSRRKKPASVRTRGKYSQSGVMACRRSL